MRICLYIAYGVIFILFLSWAIKRYKFYLNNRKYIGKYCMIGCYREPPIPLEGKEASADKKEMVCQWGIIHKMTPRWVTFTRHSGNKIRHYDTYLIPTSRIAEITIENEQET